MVQILDSIDLEEVVQRNHKIFLLPLPSLDIASKDIRKKVRMGESITDLVPETVGKYILSNDLYQ